MGEKRSEIKVYGVIMECSRCTTGNMEFDDETVVEETINQIHKESFPHVCDRCGAKINFDKIYPYTEIEYPRREGTHSYNPELRYSIGIYESGVVKCVRKCVNFRKCINTTVRCSLCQHNDRVDISGSGWKPGPIDVKIGEGYFKGYYES